MNYASIKQCDVANGTGIRVVLFVSGCSHHCPGCHNPETWDCNYGKPFTQKTVELIKDELRKSYIDGITLSGGDPLFVDNLYEILNFILDIKKDFPQKDIWCYTGYTWEQIFNGTNQLRKDIASNCDVLVDGPFVLKDRNITLKWRGSPNQRVIDVKKTLQDKRITLFCN